MINIDIVVEDEFELDKIRCFLLQEGLHFKCNSIDVYNREDSSTHFFKQIEDGRIVYDGVTR